MTHYETVQNDHKPPLLTASRQSWCTSTRSRRRSRGLDFGIAFIASICSASTQADINLMPYASGRTLYDSNVFALSSANQAVLQNGDPRRSDTVFRYAAGADASFLWNRQEVYGFAEGRRFNYLHFNQLDHDEYTLSGGSNWVISNALGGSVNYRQDRRMASFADRTTTQLEMEAERTLLARLDVKVSDEWRLDGGFKLHGLDSPLPGFPLFALDEHSGNMRIRYVGRGKLGVGLYTEYLEGDYRGVPDEGRFRQATAELTSTYAVSGLSDFDAKVGYSQRKSQIEQGGDVSGLAGTLAYKRSFTGKTSGNVQIFRRINSYVAGATSVVETGATVALRWQPSSTISVSPDYSWIETGYRGTSAPGSSFPSRRDHYQTAGISINYEARSWLSIRAFGQAQDRNSNIVLDSFNESQIGIEFVLRRSRDPSSVLHGDTMTSSH